jgi:hypothetical protein
MVEGLDLALSETVEDPTILYVHNSTDFNIFKAAMTAVAPAGFRGPFEDDPQACEVPFDRCILAFAAATCVTHNAPCIHPHCCQLRSRGGQHHTHIQCPLLQPVLEWVIDNTPYFVARILFLFCVLHKRMEASSGSQAAAKGASRE